MTDIFVVKYRVEGNVTHLEAIVQVVVYRVCTAMIQVGVTSQVIV